MKRLVKIFFIVLLFRSAVAQAQKDNDSIINFNNVPIIEYDFAEEPENTFFRTSFIEPTRLTLKHELSYKFKEPTGLKNNRTSLRLEYKHCFGEKFYLEVDNKLNTFWVNDHRAEAEDKNINFENKVIEAFAQFSIKQTSFRAGFQKMIWGESEAGAITDVISPRDYSELFFISLEESRRGQPTISIDQYTDFGDWTLFYVPMPLMNEYPKEGTAYYYDPFQGFAKITEEKLSPDDFEYGLKWKKVFGRSEMTMMAASLINNDFSYRMDGFSTTGQQLVTKSRERFNMTGITFNIVMGDFILKGEAAAKFQKTYNNLTYEQVKRNSTDAAFGLEYSPGSGSFTVNFEAVNKHIWQTDSELLGVPKRANSLVFVCRKTFLNQDLSVLWMTIYNAPYTGYLHQLLLSYKWNDNITLYAEGYYPDYKNEKNPNWHYRDQKQFDLKFQYQF